MNKTLTLFVPGILESGQGGRSRHWRFDNQYTKKWRSSVASYLEHAMREARWDVPAAVPKIITLHGIVAVRFDEDGLYKALKPVVDALHVKTTKRRGLTYQLPGCPIIDNDSPKRCESPFDSRPPTVLATLHRIIRTQAPGRPAKATPAIDPRGVHITIALKENL